MVDRLPDEGEERTFSPGLAPPRQLLIVCGRGVATCALPQHGTLVVGRARECDVRIDDPSVSRRHAVLHVGPQLSVEDAGSSYGTRLSGRRLSPGVVEPIPGGALLEVGRATIVVQGADDVAQPSPMSSRTTSEIPPNPDTGTSTMERLDRLVELVAPGRISIILIGETGVGKEVMAETIHRRSPRASKPFVRRNCAALPDTLLESELFGFERGAFTGATQSKPGLLEAADAGTLLLDEIGEMALSTQAKLLRVLENREVQRLGSLKPVALDVRIIAATHRDLEADVAAGSFRADLYYRLNGVTLAIPPLRERVVEIPGLARTFVKACTQAGQPEAPITADAMECLQRHPWAGNIRELRNVMERAALISGGGPITVEHLGLDRRTASVRPQALPLPEPPPRIAHGPLKSDLEALERQRIADALTESGGNQTKAAQILGISRRALLGRLDVYGLPRPRKGSS